MKFIDLQAQFQMMRAEMLNRIDTVLRHAQYIMGPEVYEVEQQLADYVRTAHCVTTASGTTALHVALLALDIQKGDEIITTPFGFFSSAEVIMALGAVPIFVDVDPKTYNINPSLIEQAITSKTRAIIPVNLYGQCAHYDAIQDLANRYRLWVIEDAAQSFGALYRNTRSGGLGVIGCTSFFPSKPLGCFGDGGACFTQDAHLAGVMRSLIQHGQDGLYHHVRFGMTGRFDTLQAAVILTKLPYLDQEIEQRQEVAAWYDRYLHPKIARPWIAPECKSVFAQYTVQVEHRDAVRARLIECGIPTAIHYPKALHQQVAMPVHYHQQSFPVSESLTQCVMSLPFYPYLSEPMVHNIAHALNSIIDSPDTH